MFKTKIRKEQVEKRKDNTKSDHQQRLEAAFARKGIKLSPSDVSDNVDLYRMELRWKKTKNATL